MKPAVRLIGIWAAVTLFCIAVTGTFVPVDPGDGLQYLFVPPRTATLYVLAALSAAGIAAMVLAVVGLTRRLAPDHAGAARSLTWLTPAAMVGVVAAGLVPAIPGVGERGAVLAYLCFDLRWWWVAFAVAAVTWRAARMSNAPLRRLAALPIGNLALFAAVVTFAIVTTPHLRWSAMLHGDEPKYLRYSDALAQGRGFDVSSRVPFGDQPAGARPALSANLTHLARAIATAATSLPGDLRAFAADPYGFQWNRVSGTDGFFTGRHGGVYQIHPPGLSLILLPGYTIDRFLIDSEPGYQNEFPSRLVMTTATMVMLLGGCAIALRRLLQRVLLNGPLAWAWAFVGASTLPLAAFGFQIYPEVPASLIILSVVNAVLLREPQPRRLLWSAAGAAALVWLHPRFLVVSFVLVALGAVRAQRRSTRAMVIAVAAVVLATFCLYNYLVTGSAWPLAVFDVFASEVSVAISGVPLSLLAYALDRNWGVMAHTPILMASLPGLLLIWRRDRLAAIGIAAIVLAAAIPAAAHTVSAAGGTPGRLIAAVVPLLIWPVAVFARWIWHYRIAAVGLGLLLVISVDNAVAYNLDHVKSYGRLRDTSATGWKIHQMFPAIRGEVWESSWMNAIVLFAIAAFIGALLVWTGARAGRDSKINPQRSTDEGTRVPTSYSPVVAGVLSTFAVVAFIATAAIGQWVRGDYLPRTGEALITAADALAPRESCRGCVSSKLAPFEWRDLHPSVDRVRLEPEVRDLVLALKVTAESDVGIPLTRVRIDFGDGASSAWTAVVHERELRHRYDRPGRYELVARIEWSNGGHRYERRTIDVPERAGGQPTF